MFYLQGRGTLPADTLLGLVVLAFFPTVRIDLQALLFGDGVVYPFDKLVSIASLLGGRSSSRAAKLRPSLQRLVTPKMSTTRPLPPLPASVAPGPARNSP
ncbi:MAG: hypothetical protein OXP69_12805, partial [Spirochaetaceae bacterium]|nr:hypothetical protein [Spirochaetaceae bacterium]